MTGRSALFAEAGQLFSPQKKADEREALNLAIRRFLSPVGEPRHVYGVMPQREMAMFPYQNEKALPVVDRVVQKPVEKILPAAPIEKPVWIAIFEGDFSKGLALSGVHHTGDASTTVYPLDNSEIVQEALRELTRPVRTPQVAQASVYKE